MEKVLKQALKTHNVNEEDQDKLAKLINLKAEFSEFGLEHDDHNELQNLEEWFNHEFLN